MNNEELIDKLSYMTEDINIEDFNKILSNLEYIFYDLEEYVLNLTTEEKVEYNYDIQYYIIKYLLELSKIYTKEILNMNIDYEFAEIILYGAKGAYNHKDDKIVISVLGQMVEKINNTSYLQSIFHEIRHKIQYESYKKDKIEDLLEYPSSSILLAKDNAVIENMKEDNDFYFDNYNRLYTEIDADQYGIKVIKYLIYDLYNYYMEKYNIEENDYKDRVNNLHNKINIDSKTVSEDLERLNRINNIYSLELYSYYPITNKLIIGNEETDRLIFIDKFIKNNNNLITDYPILNILYNKERLKTYKELLLEKQKLLLKYNNYSIQINKIFNNIIKSDPILLFSKYLEENSLVKINNFINIHPSFIEEYLNEIEELKIIYKNDDIIGKILRKNYKN